MANPSFENLDVWSKVQTFNDATPSNNRYNWDVSFVAITSRGTRFEERKAWPNITQAAALANIKAVCVAHETAESTPPAEPIKEFPGRYDATKAGLTELALADYPAT